jgi:hypothetical protein
VAFKRTKRFIVNFSFFLALKNLQRKNQLDGVLWSVWLLGLIYKPDFQSLTTLKRAGVNPNRNDGVFKLVQFLLTKEISNYYRKKFVPPLYPVKLWPVINFTLFFEMTF